ncbi:DNA primase [Candidatus Magnetobacterium bavaricum]|uniref:DNA primase n=1 Tax=Candidatus Magnetobacterium bavaricum TaxID=29290 RepID=A0A0F3GS89_9BACT|nr:DNA primase [Candidatus Magnetobacterium bavaricum]
MSHFLCKRRQNKKKRYTKKMIKSNDNTLRQRDSNNEAVVTTTTVNNNVNLKDLKATLDREDFNRWVSSGFKAILTRGYNPQYNPTKDYKIAKEPITKGFTSATYMGQNYESVEAHTAGGGWYAWVIPVGLIVLDVEDTWAINFMNLNRHNLKITIVRSTHGYHYIFKNPKGVTGGTEVFTKCGAEVTYRLGGKNCCIFNLTGREVENWENVEDLSELPKIYYPYDKQVIEDVLLNTAWQVGCEYHKGTLKSYEDIDTSFMGMAVKYGFTYAVIEVLFMSIFRVKYNPKKTRDAYDRCLSRVENNDPVKGFKSLMETAEVINAPILLRFLKELWGLINPKRGNLKEGGDLIGIATELMYKYSTIQSGECLYTYRNGVYVPDGESLIRLETRKILGKAASIQNVKEVIAHIWDTSHIPTNEVNQQKHLINLENGMFDITKNEIIPHDPKYRSTVRIPVTYDPCATCPEIDRFLQTTLEPDCIDLMDEAFGYTMLPDTSQEKAFMLTGHGANGKSTLISTLTSLIGDDNVSKIPLQELADHRFKRAELFGKLLNVFADLNPKSLLSTDYFKMIVSGDSMDAERKFKKPFCFRPFARLIFAANQIPYASDTTYAYYRRWVIIPFNKTFKGADADKGLISRLTTKQELSGLLNKALKGLYRLFINDRFSENASTQDMLEKYKRDNDNVIAFVSDACVLKEGVMAERNQLYNMYLIYCESEGRKAVTKNNFNKRIRLLKDVTEKAKNNGLNWYFIGITSKYNQIMSPQVAS